MKALHCATLLLLYCTFAKGHEFRSNSDRQLHNELAMKSYPADTSAAAIIIFEKGSTILNNEETAYLTYKRHVRIKVFRKEALNWANVILLVERGTLTKLNGITYNLEKDSAIRTEIDDKAIFKKRFNKYIDEISFTLPNVKEGSVIEYSYVVKGNIGIAAWKFQHSIPVVFSEYTIEIPTRYKMRHTLKGLIPPKYETKASVQKWTLNDIPAFKSEPLMPNEDDFVSSVEFSFAGDTWGHVAGTVWGDSNFGGTVKGSATGSSFLKRETEKATAGLTDTRQKIIAIHQYVKDHLEWDGTKGIYAADDLKDNFKTKKGTAADINLTMAAMLYHADVKIEMVLLSSRDNGFVRVDYPTARQFNYAICRAYVDTTAYLLDATEKYLPWHVLPQRCLNGVALAISGERYDWIDVESKVKDRTVATADLVLNDHGQLQGTLTYSRSGYAALEMRNDILKKGKERYVEDFIKSQASWNILKTEFQNLDDIEKSAIESHEISIQEHGVKSDQLIYIDPFIILKEDENPFKPEKRQFPIDFGVKNEKVYITNITLPDGYIVDEIPQPKVTTLPGKKGRFSYTVSQAGNRLTVLSSVQINERIFMEDEYPALREFYNRIVAKQSEQIVLKKKN